LNAVMVLSEPTDRTMLDLVQELHRRKLASRVVLQIIGGNPDQVDSQTLERASLVLGSNAEESLILSRLESLFAMESQS
jgi:hypothetical protein